MNFNSIEKNAHITTLNNSIHGRCATRNKEEQ